ncbi:MAG TPA: nucleotidyltransferase domain-containing protein [Desulfohalobiaceae bacterium]|nr:nucleotidyltransferase domain-containing protein [Desulfohalobiaceae bacterium]
MIIKSFWADLASRYNLEIIYAFGSRSQEIAALGSGDLKRLPVSSSDLDIGVKPQPGQHLATLDKVDLSQEIEEFLSIAKVDLIVLPEADPFLAANIIRGQRLYCIDKYQADEYELYVLRRAGDLAFLERKRQALILERT